MENNNTQNQTFDLINQLELENKTFNENLNKSGIKMRYDSENDELNKFLRIYRFIIRKSNDNFLPVEQLYDAFSLIYNKDEIDFICKDLVSRWLLMPDFKEGEIVGYGIN